MKALKDAPSTNEEIAAGDVAIKSGFLVEDVVTGTTAKTLYNPCENWKIKTPSYTNAALARYPYPLT